MMRKLMLVLITLLLGSTLLTAQQSTSKFDLFGGYSYFNGSTSGESGRFNLNGWNAQGTYNLNGWLGVTADFGGYYGSPYGVSAHDYSFLFGPTFTLRTGRVMPFAHALFGGDRFSASVLGESASDTGFAMALGGGLDIPVKGRFAIRVAQADWLRSNHVGEAQNNFRLSTGVVFRFGQ